jgi:hypothetical protein
MTPDLQVGIVTLILAVPLSAADDPPRFDRLDLTRPENAALAKKWEAIPVPAQTPFDGDARKRAAYLRSYRDGYFWAKYDHLWCPPSHQGDNLHAVRGWVEGWQAGARAGGQGDLPAKYAPYVIWRDPDRRQ